MNAAEYDFDKEENRIKYMESMINNVKSWAEKFDFVSLDIQKMIFISIHSIALSASHMSFRLR